MCILSVFCSFFCWERCKYVCMLCIFFATVLFADCFLRSSITLTHRTRQRKKPSQPKPFQTSSRHSTHVCASPPPIPTPPTRPRIRHSAAVGRGAVRPPEAAHVPACQPHPGTDPRHWRWPPTQPPPPSPTQEKGRRPELGSNQVSKTATAEMLQKLPEKESKNLGWPVLSGQFSPTFWLIFSPPNAKNPFPS